jgi:membrane protein involved in colicin uptake
MEQSKKTLIRLLSLFTLGLQLIPQAESQPSFNVLTQDGRLITSNEWVKSTDDYHERLRRQIKPLIVYLANSIDVTPCEVVVSLAEDGSVQKTEIASMSSDPSWCGAVIKAIKKSEKLPTPKDGQSPQTVSIKFKP